MRPTPIATLNNRPSMEALSQQRSLHLNKVCLIGATLLFFALIIVIGVVGGTSSMAPFRICFGAVLALIACGEMYVVVKLIVNRQNPLIELFQPLGLALFVMAAALATISCITLAFPEYDASCALRQPIILSCISFMGSILVARCWRIICIISPTLTFASSSDNKANKVHVARVHCLNVLSKFSKWTKISEFRSNCSCRRPTSAVLGTAGIRRKITSADSMRVVCVLMLPQVILQILILSVADIRMGSNVIYDDTYACQSSTAGTGLLIVGIMIASLPFFIALLLNIEVEGVPARFQEFNEILLSLKSSLWALAITLPTIGIIDDTVPSAHAYLTAASVLSFVLPLCYNIAWTRVDTLKSPGAATSAAAQRLARRTSSDVSSAEEGSNASGRDNTIILKQAEDARVTASMFETMGKREKALEIEKDILSMFKSGGDFSWEGGFSLSEISLLGPKELELVVSTLVHAAKSWANISLSIHIQRSARLCRLALWVFEKAKCKASLKDRYVSYTSHVLSEAYAILLTTSYSLDHLCLLALVCFLHISN